MDQESSLRSLQKRRFLSTCILASSSKTANVTSLKIGRDPCHTKSHNWWKFGGGNDSSYGDMVLNVNIWIRRPNLFQRRKKLRNPRIFHIKFSSVWPKFQVPNFIQIDGENLRKLTDKPLSFPPLHHEIWPVIKFWENLHV